ncbi:hypothetical protein AMTRI_Chr06g191300 [Amborella trichopoda]
MRSGSRVSTLCKVLSGSMALALCKMRFDSCTGRFGNCKRRSDSCKAQSGSTFYWIPGLRHYVKCGLTVLSFDPVVVLRRFNTCGLQQCHSASCNLLLGPKVNFKFGQNDFCI